jgi:hypothetical protein
MKSPSIKKAVVQHVLECASGGRRLFLIGLGGEGESEHASENSVVDELLAGRGGKEEHSHAVASSSASRMSYLHWIRSVVSSHLLCFSMACRGGEEGDANDAAPHTYRSQCLPKRFYGAVSTSSATLLRWRSS